MQATLDKLAYTLRQVCLAALVLLGGFGAAQAAGALAVSAGDWSRPRSADMVMGLAPVRAAVEAWSAEPDRQIVIIHAGGEAGTLWARELHDWLVALGVPSARIELRAGGGNNELQLAVD